MRASIVHALAPGHQQVTQADPRLQEFQAAVMDLYVSLMQHTSDEQQVSDPPQGSVSMSPI